MRQISDIIADYLVDQHITHVFRVSGSAAMPLQDAFGKHNNLEVVLTHDELACVMAAESYGRLTHRPAVTCVTPGAGSLPVLAGVLSARADSIPMLMITGQAGERDEQAFDLIAVAKPLTKYAVTLTDPADVLYELQKAFYLATTGRPGPVWMEISPAIQSAMVDDKALRIYDYPATDKQAEPSDSQVVSKVREPRDLVIQKSDEPCADAVNPDIFVAVLSEQLAADQIIVIASAPAFAALKSKAEQRLLVGSGSLSRGSELSAAMGACFGSGRQKIVCLVDLESIQKNLQALATIRHYQLPIKIFVLSGMSDEAAAPVVSHVPQGNLFFPSFEKIADAYEMQYVRVETCDELNNSIAYALSGHKPALCEIAVATVERVAIRAHSVQSVEG